MHTYANTHHISDRFDADRSLRDWNAVLDRYYASEGPGIWPAPSAADEVNESEDLQTCEVA
jgi:hypothetical protein